MFDKEDFQISMEKELRLRMVNDEINHCDNVEELRKQLINVTRLFTQYQHLLEIAVKQLMVQDGYALLTSDKIEIPKAQKILSAHKLRTFEIGSVIKGNLQEQIQYN